MCRLIQVVCLILATVTYVVTATTSASTACAEIAAIYTRWQQNGGTGNLAGLPSKVAYNCLRSMPFRPELAVKFVDEYMGYLQFHSTIETLKDPPSGYISTSLDLISGIERIRSKAERGNYSSHYDFDQDLKYLIGRANDGHLVAALCSEEIFHFEHGMPLVSVSKDGLELPHIYTYFDAERLLQGDSNVSPVLSIDGVGAEWWLQAYVATGLGFQDPDARYNKLFPSHAAGFSKRYWGGAWTTWMGFWPGSANVTVEFANTTKLTIQTTASWLSVNGPMTYVSGESLFEAACLPNTGSIFGSFPGSFQTAPQYKLPKTGADSFPTPVIRHEHDLLRGYYIDSTDLLDTAILQVPTFNLAVNGTPIAETARNFLQKAFRDGKSRVIIDLSGNGGGDVNQGLNLFRLFFPAQPIYSATRFRSTKLIHLMGKVFSAPQSANILAELGIDPYMIASNAVTPDQTQAYTSWESLFGPHDVNGTQMSSVYSVFNLTAASTEANPISGYGTATQEMPTGLFQAKNIIMITDGYCGSTCAMFARLMKKQGVRSVTFGGRPKHGPMQASGGVKGAQHWSISQISKYISAAHDIATKALESDSPILTLEELTELRRLAPPSVEKMSFNFDRYGNSGINFRSAYGESDHFTPLHFVYEAAECRLFYTAENVVHPESVWLAANRAMFGDGDCVQGSRNATKGIHHN